MPNIFKRSIMTLDLPAHLKQSLHDQGISTIGQMVSLREEDYKKMPGFGERSTKDLKIKLAFSGFRLGTKPDEIAKFDDIFSFNSGRQYSSDGQRIAVMSLNDGRIVFTDHDRRAERVTTTTNTFTNDQDLQSFVMQEYDAGKTLPIESLLGYFSGEAELYKLRSNLRLAAANAPTIGELGLCDEQSLSLAMG